MHYKVRYAQESDCQSILNLLAQLGYPDKTGKLTGRFKSILSEHLQSLLVCEADNQVHGFAAMHIVRDVALPMNTAVISYFVVADGSRGNGVGSLLENACSSLAKEMGCSRIQLHCAEHREQAHRFYENLGYAESPKYYTKAI